MTADGSFLKAVAGAIVLFGFVQTVTPASANWLERPSVKQRLSAGLKQAVRCDPATEWTRQTFKAFASCQASIHGLEPLLAHAVMEIESGFDPGVQGADGEVGLMQVMPATARMLGFRGSLDDLSAPATNIALGVRYLAQANRLAGGDLCTTVMKYRAGHNESRFSAHSVRYCQRARAILAREGIEVTGPLPVATFGFSAFSGGEGGAAAQFWPGKGAKGVCVRRLFVPGPRYMKCADYRSAGQARQIRTLRGRLFGG
ncbi:lytic transglycosylase domain-containing protein [Mesorhizobium sp. M0088]|uniref:lytic transglycosylase domain-containing protein n=1 Tax=Mesorhizobium sp. M0088 TaxID=2956873 RepID=UPI003339CEEB